MFIYFLISVEPVRLYGPGLLLGTQEYLPIEINLAGPDEADESPRRKVNPKKKQRKIVKSIRHNK